MAGAVHQNDIENNPKIPAMQQIAIRCVLAAELAYKNAEQINAAVTDQWGMNFIGFFDCWNDFLRCNTTQAFVFTDTPSGGASHPARVFAAFRGTQKWDCKDWLTDCRIADYEIRGLGRVHTGFLEALGLGTRDDIATLELARKNMLERRNGSINDNRRTSGLPRTSTNTDRGAAADLNEAQNGGRGRVTLDNEQRVLAYDAISDKVRPFVDAGAKLYVTGHSLGGALATLFAAVRLLEMNDEDPTLGGVFTFGQPRVGDAAFARYVEATLSPPPPPRNTQTRPRNGQAHERKYFRVVFRSDIVPCLPFNFTHIRPCYFYRSVDQSEVLDNRPCCLRILPRISAFNDLHRSLVHGSRSVVPLSKKFLAVLMPEICDHSIVYYITAIQQAPNPFSA